MKLVVLLRHPPRADQAAAVLAEASGLSLAEARMRLAPEPPALLARLEAERAEALVGELRRAGLTVLALQTPCPDDRDRTVVRRFTLGMAGATLTPGTGEALQFTWPEVAAVLRGSRASRTEVERVERSRAFSPVRALATGGLVTSKTSSRVVRTSSEEVEQVLLLYLRDGRAAVLAEQELEFSSLGPAMQPSHAGNMAELARRLRDHAPGAFYDERLLRLGRRPLPFLAGKDARSETSATVTTRSDTGESLDVLAEALRQAVAEGFLP
jgi:hypothetical protein